MAEIHARLPDGTWVHGVDVFRFLYTLLGWAPVVWISRLPIVSGMLDCAYRLFAESYALDRTPPVLPGSLYWRWQSFSQMSWLLLRHGRCD